MDGTFKNDEAGKKINWYFLGNENAGYQITKATLTRWIC